MMLELPDLLAHRGLVTREGEGGLREAAAVQHLHEGAHGVETVHVWLLDGPWEAGGSVSGSSTVGRQCVGATALGRIASAERR